MVILNKLVVLVVVVVCTAVNGMVFKQFTLE